MEPNITDEEFEIQRQFVQVVNNKTSIRVSKYYTLFALYKVNEWMNELMTEWKKWEEIEGNWLAWCSQDLFWSFFNKVE